MFLIAMAGLPGTGKSTLAAKLAERIGGVVLNKDAVRAEMFPVVEYTREQDDAAVAWMYDEAARVIADLPVIIDGRTFSKGYQIRDLFEAAARMGTMPKIIECVASDDVVKARLERDLEAGIHPAKNRTFEMYRQVKANAEPLTVPRLILDTSTVSFEECVERAVAHLQKQ
jgi:predicted kinase